MTRKSPGDKSLLRKPVFNQVMAGRIVCVVYRKRVLDTPPRDEAAAPAATAAAAAAATSMAALAPQRPDGTAAPLPRTNSAPNSKVAAPAALLPSGLLRN